MTLRALLSLFLRDLVRRRMLWAIVLVTLAVLALNYGIRRTMESALGEGASWDMATRRATSNLEQLAAQARRWLPVSTVLLAAVVAPESRRNGTTQFALSCGVRREAIAAAQFLAFAIIDGLVVAIVHVGFAIPGITTGAISASEVALAWVGLLVPILALGAAVFAFSLTATAFETYLLFLGVPFAVQTIPALIRGLPRWLPRPVVTGIDNVSLLFPEIDAIIPWPHLSYGRLDGLPHPQWQWPVAHQCAVIAFWLVLGLWRYRRHDFGSRTAVK
ncbi:MAG: hypothetical protein KF819_21760 [Labilithrix sp.]|nr:hypothetical protein [Labilithrix sp.]